MLHTGMEGRLERIVTDEMTARACGSGTLEVFATPAMIALAEETAWQSVQGDLEEGQGTVGTKLDIAHIAATPVGMKVRCESLLTQIDRRRLVFKIEVYDEAGKIGSGTHERFIVDLERFQAKADGRSAVTAAAE